MKQCPTSMSGWIVGVESLEAICFYITQREPWPNLVVLVPFEPGWDLIRCASQLPYPPHQGNTPSTILGTPEQIAIGLSSRVAEYIALLSGSLKTGRVPNGLSLFERAVTYCQTVNTSNLV